MKTMKAVLLSLVLCGTMLGQATPQPKVHPKAQPKKGLKAKVNKATGVTSPSVALSCTPATTGGTATSFNFYRFQSTTATCPASPAYTKIGTGPTCAYTDSTVVDGTTYCYVATGLNASGESGNSNQVTATVPVAAPNPPTGLTVGTITAKNVPLKWQAPLGQPEYTLIAYEVFRGGTPTLPSPGMIALVPSSVTSFTDSGCGGKCYYEIKSYSISGLKFVVSKPSNIVEAVE
jgi:hypothetical protein